MADSIQLYPLLNHRVQLSEILRPDHKRPVLIERFNSAYEIVINVAVAAAGPERAPVDVQEAVGCGVGGEALLAQRLAQDIVDKGWEISANVLGDVFVVAVPDLFLES